MPKRRFADVLYVEIYEGVIGAFHDVVNEVPWELLEPYIEAIISDEYTMKILTKGRNFKAFDAFIDLLIQTENVKLIERVYDKPEVFTDGERHIGRVVSEYLRESQYDKLNLVFNSSLYSFVVEQTLENWSVEKKPEGNEFYPSLIGKMLKQAVEKKDMLALELVLHSTPNRNILKSTIVDGYIGFALEAINKSIIGRGKPATPEQVALLRNAPYEPQHQQTWQVAVKLFSCPEVREAIARDNFIQEIMQGHPSLGITQGNPFLQEALKKAEELAAISMVDAVADVGEINRLDNDRAKG